MAKKSHEARRLYLVVTALLSLSSYRRRAVAAATFFSFSKVDRGGPILDGENSPRVDNIRPFRYNLMFSFLASISFSKRALDPPSFEFFAK